jgi:hypothetical protein
VKRCRMVKDRIRLWKEGVQYCSAQILLVEHRGYEYTGGS